MKTIMYCIAVSALLLSNCGSPVNKTEEQPASSKWVKVKEISYSGADSNTILFNYSENDARNVLVTITPSSILTCYLEQGLIFRADTVDYRLSGDTMILNDSERVISSQDVQSLELTMVKSDNIVSKVLYEPYNSDFPPNDWVVLSPDSREPDGSMASATLLEISDTLFSTITVNDTDYFKFHADSGEVISVVIASTMNTALYFTRSEDMKIRALSYNGRDTVIYRSNSYACTASGEYGFYIVEGDDGAVGRYRVTLAEYK